LARRGRADNGKIAGACQARPARRRAPRGAPAGRRFPPSRAARIAGAPL